MADIKTRDAVKGTIKTIDKAAIATERMKSAYAKTKDKAEQGFYNKLGFRTSSDFGIFTTSGYPMKEPRCMMCKELYPKALSGITGYVVYDMYCNA